MKCNACSEEVSSKFAHAIATNSCPFCGNPIMEASLQEVLNGLREIMSEANDQDYLIQAFDWLKSNFNLLSMESEEYQTLIGENNQLKTELEELKSRGGKGSAHLKKNAVTPQLVVDDEGNELQINGDQIQDENTTSGFTARAGIKQNNQDHFRNIVAKLKKNAGGGSGGASEPSFNPMALSLDQLERLEMQSGGLPGPSSAIDHDHDYANGDIDPIMQQFLNGVHIPGQGQDMQGANMKDLMTLNKMRERVEANQQGGHEFKFTK